jgi:hypothetical protein
MIPKRGRGRMIINSGTRMRLEHLTKGGMVYGIAEKDFNMLDELFPVSRCRVNGDNWQKDKLIYLPSNEWAITIIEER